MPPVIGAHGVKNGVLWFQPRYSLQPGLRYRAVFKPPHPTCGAVTPITAVFKIPKPDTAPTTVVEHLYPSTNRLPETQLKFYLHFSAPMSRGEAYRRIQLLDEEGRPVELPFLELDQELWDVEGKRLTILFDPGRVKRDLMPHREVGPTEPLTVQFPEPLDQALLFRLLDVVEPTGGFVEGVIAVDRQETRRRFTPATPWKPGRYYLSVGTTLEDLAGDSIGRPFEVECSEGAEERGIHIQQTQRLRFDFSPVGQVRSR